MGSAERRSVLCGSRIIVDVDLDDAGRVALVGMQVNACAYGQAAATLLARHVVGRSGAELDATRDAVARWLAGEGTLPDWPGLDALVGVVPHSARHGGGRRGARGAWARDMTESLLLDGVILLGSGLIFVLIFRKLGLGATLGYLVAGALVGPQALGLVGGAEAKIALTRVTLRPDIRFDGPAPTAQQLETLHHAAHEDCFIASAVTVGVGAGALGAPTRFLRTSTHSTLCTHTPMGVKGCGEVGTIGSPAAVISAVVDALAHLGISHVDMPATPNRIWRIIQNAAPATLAAWLTEPDTLRARLAALPAAHPLPTTHLRACQIEAITALEASFAADRPRALIQMATGAGKTYTACAFTYRLIKFAGARRVLFLVDRGNLGKQAKGEFDQFVAPDTGRKFTEVYNVQHLTSNSLDTVARVTICTIQRLYSILRGEAEFDEDLDEKSAADLSAADARPKDVAYNAAIPLEAFDFIVTDECHRSIYGLWRQVLEYFDAHLIGLTATPSQQTVAFFRQNLVMEYTHERAVADRVNV
eukprot:gene35448-47651_t